jgi:NNP family nitrate/nitrite transporter-like MFS transporter
MGSELNNSRKAWSVLIVSTLAFTVCFMVWMMFGVIGIPIKKMLNLNATQFGLLTAVPVLTGSLIRVPLGIWTDKLRRSHCDGSFDGHHGASHLDDELRNRILALPDHRAVCGPGGRVVFGRHALMWLAGFPKSRQGMAMGVYGAGNSGAAVNKFIAPVLLVAFGWAMVPQVYAAVMLGALILFWMFSHSDPKPIWCPATFRSWTSSRR